MNEFERARAKALKNGERAAKYREQAPVLPPQTEPVVEAPKEKEPDNGAVISVWVQLPDQAFAMKFSKPGVYQNATRSKLTKQAISNAIKDGLRPLLGSVSEV